MGLSYGSPYLLERVLKYGPVGCVGKTREAPFPGPYEGTM